MCNGTVQCLVIKTTFPVVLYEASNRLLDKKLSIFIFGHNIYPRLAADIIESFVSSSHALHT